MVRNKFYDVGIFKSTNFNIPVICVGNLAVGGSGKTPVTEYLVRLLSGKRIAILSRGYGRNTKGFILADGTANAATIGDEPMQYYSKFKSVTVAVCEDRVKGITLLKDNHDVIILDDAYQHRRVTAGFNILLFEYATLFKPQFLMPAGNLREPFANYKRAHAILITKAPAQITPISQATIQKKFNDVQQLFTSSLQYQHLIPIFSGEEPLAISSCSTVFLLTGIANPAPLISYLQPVVTLHHHEYPDHHQYTVQEINKLINAFNNDPSVQKIIITTEKDAQRLLDAPLKELLLDLPVFYLPIQVALHQAVQHTFDQKILDYVSGTTRNR